MCVIAEGNFFLGRVEGVGACGDCPVKVELQELVTSSFLWALITWLALETGKEFKEKVESIGLL